MSEREKGEVRPQTCKHQRIVLDLLPRSGVWGREGPRSENPHGPQIPSPCYDEIARRPRLDYGHPRKVLDAHQFLSLKYIVALSCIAVAVIPKLAN